MGVRPSFQSVFAVDEKETGSVTIADGQSGQCVVAIVEIEKTIIVNRIEHIDVVNKDIMLAAEQGFGMFQSAAGVEQLLAFVGNQHFHTPIAFLDVLCH